MGFASMFEDITEALDGKVHSIVVQEQRRVANHVKSQASQLEATHDGEPPMAFTETASNLLSEDGCPPYLIKDYLNWMWQYLIGQKSMDQIWHEFSRVAIPLMTPYLQRGDPITLAFVRKHLLMKGSHGVR